MRKSENSTTKQFDDELAMLLDMGISRERIEIGHHPNCKTVITVDGNPVATFTLGYLDLSSLPQPKESDWIVLNKTVRH